MADEREFLRSEKPAIGGGGDLNPGQSYGDRGAAGPGPAAASYLSIAGEGNNDYDQFRATYDVPLSPLTGQSQFEPDDAGMLPPPADESSSDDAQESQDPSG